MNILTLAVLVPVYSAYKNLVISSIALSRFNRLGSSFSSRTGMSSLGCVINFSRYLVLWLVISALTVGIKIFFLPLFAINYCCNVILVTLL